MALNIGDMMPACALRRLQPPIAVGGVVSELTLIKPDLNP